MAYLSTLIIWCNTMADRIPEHTVWTGLNMDTKTGPFRFTAHVWNAIHAAVVMPPCMQPPLKTLSLAVAIHQEIYKKMWWMFLHTKIAMATMLSSLMTGLPMLILPSTTNCTAAVRNAPSKEVMEHKVKGASNCIMVAACNVYAQCYHC